MAMNGWGDLIAQAHRSRTEHDTFGASCARSSAGGGGVGAAAGLARRRSSSGIAAAPRATENVGSQRKQMTTGTPTTTSVAAGAFLSTPCDSPRSSCADTGTFHRSNSASAFDAAAVAPSAFHMPGGTTVGGALAVLGPPPGMGHLAPQSAHDIATVNIVRCERGVDSSGKKSDVVWYELHCRTATHHWSVAKRYSDCRAFHEMLRTMLGSRLDSAPPFPGRHVLSTQTDAFVRKRRDALEAYLCGLVTLLRGLHDISELECTMKPELAGLAHKCFVCFLDFLRTESFGSDANNVRARSNGGPTDLATFVRGSSTNGVNSGIGGGHVFVRQSSTPLFAPGKENNASGAVAGARRPSPTPQPQQQSQHHQFQQQQQRFGGGTPRVPPATSDTPRTPRPDTAMFDYATAVAARASPRASARRGMDPHCRVTHAPGVAFCIVMLLPGCNMRNVYVAPCERDTTSVVVGGNWGIAPSALAIAEARRRPAPSATSRVSLSAASTPRYPPSDCGDTHLDSAATDPLDPAFGDGMAPGFNGTSRSQLEQEHVMLDTLPVGSFEMVFPVPAPFQRGDWQSDFSSGILYLVWRADPALLPQAPLNSARKHHGLLDVAPNNVPAATSSSAFGTGGGAGTTGAFGATTTGNRRASASAGNARRAIVSITGLTQL